MPWYAWVLLAWWAFGGVCTILSIGKPRVIITPRFAVVVVLFLTAQAYIVVELAT